MRGFQQISGRPSQLNAQQPLLSCSDRLQGRNVSPVDLQAARALDTGRNQDHAAMGQQVLARSQRGNLLRPRTLRQKTYVEAMERHDLTFALGPAGTGKTFLATVLAVRMLTERKVERLILTRPAVEAGERLGFLPGDLQQKVDPYLRPLYDALHSLLGPEKTSALLEKGVIEVAPLAYMRGRTLSEAFVILDEAQNTTPAQMRMVLTRLGERSRMVVTGDITQVDLPAGQLRGLVRLPRCWRVWKVSRSANSPQPMWCVTPRATSGRGLRQAIKPMAGHHQQPAAAGPGQVLTSPGPRGGDPHLQGDHNLAKAAKVHLVIWGDMPASSNFQEAIREAQSSALVGPNVVNKALPYVGGGMVLTAAGVLGGIATYVSMAPGVFQMLSFAAIIPWFILFFVAQNAANKANNSTALPLLVTFSLLMGFTLTGLVLRALAVAAPSVGIAALATGITFVVASIFGRRMSDSVGQALSRS